MVEIVEDQPRSGNSINIFQFLLIGACFVSVESFSKLSLNLYFGKSWFLIIYILFFLVFAPVVIYLQFRFSAQYSRGLLSLHEKYSPWTIIFTIATIIYNFYNLILNSISIAYSLSYVFFNFFPCDMKYCKGDNFIWASCEAKWAAGSCAVDEPKIFSHSTPEEKFFINFIISRELAPNFMSSFPEWFQIPGLSLLPYFLGWFLLILLVIGGLKFFTTLLYILVPVSIGTLIGSLVYIVVEKETLTKQSFASYIGQFYNTLVSRHYISSYIWDEFNYKPLYWGLVSTMVNLTSISRIFHGIYPVIATWLPAGKKTRHLSWSMVLFLAGLLNNIPILLIFISAMSDFDETILRCRLSAGWMTPFTIITHVFTKLNTRKIISGTFFIGLSISYLLSQALLFICTIENIVLHLGKWSQSIDERISKAYNISTYLIALCLSLIGIIFMTSSGYYWYRMVDWYKDRLFACVILAQCTSILILYFKHQSSRFERLWLKSIFSILHTLVMVTFVVSWIWYGVYVNEAPPDHKCVTSTTPDYDPLTKDEYKFIGWLIASMPLILGTIIGLFVNSKNAQLSDTPVCSYLIRGEVAIEKANEDYISQERNRDMMEQKTCFLPQAKSFSHTNPFYGPSTMLLNDKVYERNRYVQSPSIIPHDPYFYQERRSHVDSYEDRDPYRIRYQDEYSSMSRKPEQQSYRQSHYYRTMMRDDEPKIEYHHNYIESYPTTRRQQQGGIYKTKSSNSYELNHDF